MLKGLSYIELSWVKLSWVGRVDLNHMFALLALILSLIGQFETTSDQVLSSYDYLIFSVLIGQYFRFVTETCYPYAG